MRKRLLSLSLLAAMAVMGGSAWALDQKDGVYQINSLEDYLAFASLVNTSPEEGGNPAANAVLNVDIDLGTDGTMIGTCVPDYYQGTFDGQGHTIKVNAYPTTADYGIFKRLQKTAEVRNLRTDVTVTTSKKTAAGIASYSQGAYIHNCYVECTVNSGVSGDGTHAGVVAVAERATFIADCFVKFNMNGVKTTNCGGIIGWSSNYTTVQNCVVVNETNMENLKGSGTISRNADANLQGVDVKSYATGTRPGGASYGNFATAKWDNVKYVTVVDKEALKDGSACYQLNSDQSKIIWTQEIGKDEYPLPTPFGSGKQVYASVATDCQGHVAKDTEVAYSNTASGVTCEKHEIDKFGVCPKCGYFDYSLMPRDEKEHKFTLSSEKDFWLAEGQNRIARGTFYDMKLLADVTLNADSSHVFNNDNWYGGTFDGQGHELTINFVNAPNGASLLPQLQGTVKNLTMHGLISGIGKNYASVACQTRAATAKIENVYSDVVIETTYAGDATNGGLIAVVETKTAIDNSIYNGSIVSTTQSTTNCGGLVGWCNDNVYLTNCAFTGTIVDVTDNTYSIARNPSKLVMKNTYYVNAYTPEGGNLDGATQVDASAVESGELAFMLNGGVSGYEGGFYQAIGKDKAPYTVELNHGKVYAVASSYRCDGKPIGSVTYSNTAPSASIPDHKNEHGFCTVCGKIDLDYIKPAEDGWYELADGHALTWWSNYAANVNLGASARLTADIEMTDEDNERYAAIGTELAPYYGSFDGQFHRIKNLHVSYPQQLGVGLISVMNSERKSSGDDNGARAKDPIFIRDLILDQSCSLTGKGYVGIIGMTAPWGGNILVQNVGMEGDVKATENANAGGVLGCVMSSSCKITIDNSYMAGNVYGVTENASFSGWLGSYATVSNCYAIGTVENPQNDERYFARYGTCTFTNCFTRNGGELKQNNNVVVAKVSDADIANGALAFRANGKTSVEPKWYQNLDGDEIDEHPVAVPTHGVVFKLTEGYMSVANEEELNRLTATIADEATNYADVTMAERAVVEEYTSAASALADLNTIAEVAKAYEQVLLEKDTANVSANKYKKYVTEMEKVQAYLADHTDFQGDERDLLEDYFENADGPSEDYPFGGYKYITEEMLTPSDSLASEITRVNEALQNAIKYGYIPGTNVSGLLTNADFLQGKTGWTGAGSIGATTYTLDGKQVAGAERWAGSVDMSQTVEGMKPGYYLMEVTGASRASNDRYGLNYIATLEANGINNYFMADIEDPILYADAKDQENCNIHGATSDLPIFEDGESTSAELGGDTVAFVMHGQLSVATVVNAGVRYKNYTLGYVGEDGKLTVRLRQDKSGYDNDWFGFGNVVLTYCGDAASEQTTAALESVLTSQIARANTILEKYPDYRQKNFDKYKKAPNFPTSLCTALAEAVNAAEDAADNEAKIAAVEKLSDIFLQIRDAKKAYANMACVVEALTDAIGKVSGELGDDYDKIANDCNTVLDGYETGSYSIEQAQALEMLQTPEIAPFVPETRGDTLLLSSKKQMAYFSSYVSKVDNAVYAELTNNIEGFDDLLSIQNYYGTLDGKFHTIKVNIVKGSESNDAAIFTTLYGNVKNLNVAGTITTDSKYAAGVAAHAYSGATIEKVTSSVNIVSNISGDATHGGIVAVVESGDMNIKNCVFNGSMTGEASNSCGGIAGWLSGKANITNCLQIGDIQVGTSNGHTFARTGTDSYRNVSNCYYLKAYGDAAGTQTNEEQMKSGELCYKLNGSSSDDPAWFQTLGTTDTVPHLTPGDIVYYYGLEYINVKPNIQLNSYASNVNIKSDAEKVVVSYLLNAPAQEGEIRFYNAAKDLVYTETLATADLTEGAHAVTVSNTSLPEAGTALTFDVKVKGFGSKDATRVGDVQKMYAPYGMAVMNDPESPAFGNIYVTESNDDTSLYGAGVAEGYISDTKHSALYMLNPLFNVVNAADGTPGWKGGMEDGKRVNACNSYSVQDYKNVRCSQDGRLFVSRISGKNASPIFEVNPEDMEEAWSPIFTGGTQDKETGITYVGSDEQARMNVSFDVAGKGDNMQLLTLGIARSDGGFNYTDYKANIYNLGSAKQWTKAADFTFEPLTGQYTIAPMPVNILSDQHGGAWYVQYRSAPKEVQPAIKHYNAKGEEDYSDISTNLAGGGCAISPDGTMLAVSKQGSIFVVKTNYEVMPNGLIFLEPVVTFNHKESTVTAMAFDYAGNLMVAAAGSETLARYVLPSQTDNVTVTPASSRCSFKVGEIKTAIDQISSEDAGMKIYNLQGVQLQKAEKGVNIINGRKVMVK